MHEEPREWVVSACAKLRRDELVELVDRVSYRSFGGPADLAREVWHIKYNGLLRRADQAWDAYQQARADMQSRFPQGCPSDLREWPDYRALIERGESLANLSDRYHRQAARLWELNQQSRKEPTHGQ